MNDKWSQFRNFMFNELGITKEDIRTWIKEAVQEQATQLVGQAHGAFDAERIIDRQVSSRLTDIVRNDTKLRREVAEKLAARLVVIQREQSDE